jgi:hypothetical protein
LIPPTFDVTVPVPDPAVATSSEKIAVPVNAAVTERAWLIVTTHVDALPEQAPDHEESDCPDPGVAVNVTSWPLP